jgi:hypothetical protein
MRTRFQLGLASAAFCASLCAVTAATAQTPRINKYSVHPQLGLNLGYLGELKSPATLSNSGFGGAINYRQPLDKLGITAVRIEAAFAGFGGDRTTVVERQGTSSESLTEVRSATNFSCLTSESSFRCLGESFGPTSRQVAAWRASSRR